LGQYKIKNPESIFRVLRILDSFLLLILQYTGIDLCGVGAVDHCIGGLIAVVRDSYMPVAGVWQVKGAISCLVAVKLEAVGVIGHHDDGIGDGLLGLVFDHMDDDGTIVIAAPVGGDPVGSLGEIGWLVILCVTRTCLLTSGHEGSYSSHQGYKYEYFHDCFF
jgi:hypothetical protein